MRKIPFPKISLTTALVIVALAVLATALAAVSLTVHQTLTVPQNEAIVVYQADGVTEITPMTDISPPNGWTWTGTQFALQLQIQNTGNAPKTVRFLIPTIAGWTITPNSNSTVLAIGQKTSFSITAIPPNGNAGTTTNDFDITFRAE